MPELFQTRANWILNVCYLVTILAPFVCYWSVRIVKRNDYAKHRKVQTILLATCVAAVLLLEVQIRVAGGSGALMGDGPYSGSSLFRTIATIHIIGAILTYVLWIWLLIASRRAYRRTLPGKFSKWHKWFGWATFLGLCFTTISATFVYYMAFVA